MPYENQNTGGGGYGPSGGTGGGYDAIGAAIQAGAAIYEGYQNRKASKENTDKTIAAQREEAEKAYQRQMQQTSAANEYNSPEAQMQRYIEAGLNPHLIYGQGTPGNQSSIPQYSPPNIQYKYESAHTGAALQSVLPTLMAVGTWVQNMRLQRAQINKTEMETIRGGTEAERTRQLIDFLTQRNPQILSEGSNKLSLFPYQKQVADYGSNTARTKLFELEQEFRYKYGDDLFNEMGSAWTPQSGRFQSFGGSKALSFAQEKYKTDLLRAKSSWSDFDITDPQALMQLVLSGVMGLAGQSLRLSTHKRPKTTHETEETMRTGRKVTRRRIYEK